jgi:hypothetical protein
MGIMKEKLEAVMSEWDKEDEMQKTNEQKGDEMQKTRKPMSPERLEKLREQAKSARAVRAAKKVERLKAQKNVGVGLSAVLPAQYKKKEKMLAHGEWRKKIDELSVAQARALYDELKKLFGG